MQSQVWNILGNFDEIKSDLTQQSSSNSLIGVVKQPSTPIATKVKNPFAASAVQGSNLAARIIREDKKNVVNGQHKPKHPHQKIEIPDSKNIRSKLEGRTGVFEQFQTKSESVLSTKAGSHARTKTEDKSSSNKVKERTSSNNREKLKSKSELVKKVVNSGTKADSKQDIIKTHEKSKAHGASSAGSTPNSQSSTASSGYGSLQPSNSVLSQIHTSSSRENRDSDSVKSTPSPDEPVFQSPHNRVNVNGRVQLSNNSLKPKDNLPNGMSTKNVNKHRSPSGHSKSRGLKLKIPDKVSKNQRRDRHSTAHFVSLLFENE